MATLIQVASGTVDIVLLNGIVPTLQFNCECVDALPYCQAMCCKMRNMHNTIVTEAEAKALVTIDHPLQPGKRILDYNQETLECIYQESNNKCALHNTDYKPAACIEWHCSPRGGLQDPKIKVRDKGWAFIPVEGNHQDR